MNQAISTLSTADPIVKKSAILLVFVGLFLLPGCATHPRTTDRTPHTAPFADMAELLAAEDGRIVTDELLAAIDSENPQLRAVAYRAIGRIGAGELSEQLQTRYGSEKDAVARASIIGALGKLEPGPPRALLEEGLTDDSPGVRIAAARALDLNGDAWTHEALLGLFNDEDNSVAVLAMYAMTTAENGNVFVPVLLEHLPDLRGSRRLAALFAVSRFAAVEKRLEFDTRQFAREAMLTYTRSGSPLVRLFATHGLTRPTGETEAARLGELTEDPVPTIRVEAIRALSFVGAPAAPFLMQTILDENDNVAMATIRRLGKMKGPDILELLANYILQSDRLNFRLMGLKSLIESDARVASGMSNGLSQTPDEAIRHAIAGLMPGVSGEAGVEQTMRRLARDPSPWVREAFLPALGTVPGTLSDLLGPFMEDHSTTARLGVLGAIGYRLDDEDSARRDEAWVLLRKVWDEARTDGDLTLIEAAMDLFVRQERESIEPFLREALEVEFRPLQVQAADALTSRGADVSLPAPTAPRTPDTYREIAEWAATPHAAIVTVRRVGFSPARFTIRLNSSSAPMAAWQFTRLATEGFYDGVEFFDIDPGRSIFTGAPIVGGVGRPDHYARDEVSLNPFGPGTIAMVADRPDRIGSRWLISTGLQPATSSRATAIGRVVQNYAGVVANILPGDEIVSIEIYEGDGTEPLP